RTTSQLIGSMPTQAMRDGDVTAQKNIIYDPLTRMFGQDAAGNPLAISASPFPGNKVPGARFNKISLKLLQYQPLPNKPTTAFVNTYITQGKVPTNTDQFTQRVDWTMNEKMNWFGRYSFDYDYLGEARQIAISAGGVTTDTWQAVLGNTYV